VTASTSSAEFERRLGTHMGIVRKVAATYRRTPADRADLTQDILASVWSAWPDFDETRSFSTWMYRIALNVAISSHRYQRRRRHEPLGDEHDHLQGASDVDFEERQKADLVARAMQALSDTDRALLLLHLEGHGHRDIADVLGTSEGNVAVRFNRIKTRLRGLAGQN